MFVQSNIQLVDDDVARTDNDNSELDFDGKLDKVEYGKNNENSDATLHTNLCS